MSIPHVTTTSIRIWNILYSPRTSLTYLAVCSPGKPWSPLSPQIGFGCGGISKDGVRWQLCVCGPPAGLEVTVFVFSVAK